MIVYVQVCGLRVGQQVLAINGQPINFQNPTEHFGVLNVVGEAPPPLYLTIIRRSSEYAVLSPQGGSLGFNVKGSAPVIISSTDKGEELLYGYGKGRHMQNQYFGKGRHFCARIHITHAHGV
jgi:hypothetical protein